MKKVLFVIIFFSVFSCTKTEMFDTTTVQLIGSKYFHFDKTVDYSLIPTIIHDYRDQYNVLEFHQDSVDYYLWTETGGKNKYSIMKWGYKFSKDVLKITSHGLEIYSGTKSGDTINIMDDKYIKK